MFNCKASINWKCDMGAFFLTVSLSNLYFSVCNIFCVHYILNLRFYFQYCNMCVKLLPLLTVDFFFFSLPNWVSNFLNQKRKTKQTYIYSGCMLMIVVCWYFRFILTWMMRVRSIAPNCYWMLQWILTWNRRRRRRKMRMMMTLMR